MTPSTPEPCCLVKEIERSAGAFLRYELRYTAEDGVHESGKEMRLLLKAGFQHSLEIRLGTSIPDGDSRLFLVRGEECPQLHAEYILIQPEVTTRDPRRGWLPVGGLYPDARYLGTDDSPEFDFGAGVAPDHAMVSLTEEGVWISDSSDSKTVVLAHPDDVRRWTT